MADINSPFVIWRTGQSNSWGVNVGETLSRADIPYWDTLLSSLPGSDAFHSLDGTHISGGGGGADATMGRLLKDAGYDIIIVNISRGATYSNQWVNGGFVEALFAAECADAWAALQALRPGARFRHVHVRDIGEQDVRNPANLNALAWEEDNNTFHSNFEAIIGSPIERIAVYTHYTLDGALWSDILRTEQTSWAGGAARCVNRDGVAYESDGVHPTSAGYISLGVLLAEKFQELYPMGSLGTYAANAMLDHELNQATHTPATDYYVHLYSGGQGLNALGAGANGYAALTIANDTTTWPTPSGRGVANGIAFTWDTPDADWPDVDEVRITTSATEGAGSIVASDTFDPIEVTPSTGPFEVAVGDFTVTAPTGGWVDAVVHRMLGLVFGGTTYAATATEYISYWAGDPQGAGAQAGSRVAMTMASQFANAAAGAAVNSAAVSLTQQVTGTYVAVHDAAVAGNLVYSGARPETVGATGTILAGQLRFTVT